MLDAPPLPRDHPDRVRARAARGARERAYWALTAWDRLRPHEREIFADFAARQARSAGEPSGLPPFGQSLDEQASDWARWASSAELLAYAKATWARMTPAERRRFSSWARRQPR